MRLLSVLTILFVTTAVAHAQTNQANSLRPELDLRIGHASQVTSLTFTSDGKTVVSSSFDGTIKLWDDATGTLRRTINAQTGWVSSIAVSPDGKTLVGAVGQFGSPDNRATNTGEVKFWDISTGALLRTLTHPDMVEAVAFSPDSRVVASGCHDKTVRLWEAQTGKLLRSLPDYQASVGPLVFSPDGKLLAAGTLAGGVGEVKLWDAQTGVLRQTLATHEHVVSALAFSQDGKIVATNSGTTIEIWDGQTGKLLRALAPPINSSITFLAFSSDGKTLASASSADGTVQLWDALTGTILRTIDAKKGWVYRGRFSPDGKTLATGGDQGSIKLWDAQTGAEQRTLGQVPVGARFLAASADGKLLAVANGSLTGSLMDADADTNDRGVHLWDVQTGELKRLIASQNSISAVAFSPDSELLATLSGDGKVQFWDTQTGKLRQVLMGPQTRFGFGGLAFSLDGKTISAGGWDAVMLWDMPTGKLRNTLSVPRTLALAFSPDGKVLAISGPEVKLCDGQSGALLRTLTGHRGAVFAMAFAPDGKTLVSGTLSDEKIRLWNVQTGTIERTLLTEKADGMSAVSSLAFSPDGKNLVSTGHQRVKVWNAQTGTLLQTLKADSPWVLSLTFIGKSQILASGGPDGIKLWDIAKGRLLATLHAIPPQDATGRFSSAIIPPAQGSRETQAVPDYLVVTPEGYYMGSATADRYVRFRLGKDSFPAESFQARYYRPDLVKQALAGKELPPVGDFKGPVPPILSFTLPQSNTVRGNTMTIAVETTDDSDVRSVAFFINGARVDAKPITADSRPITVSSKAISADAKAISADARPIIVGSRELPVAHKIARRVTATLPLPPDVYNIKVQAIAFDDDGLQSPRGELLFTRDTTAKVAGKLLGLCVGVSRYQDPRLNLKFADADAAALSQALNQQRGIYSSAQVNALSNEQATCAAIKVELGKLITQTTRNDTVVLSLSGHGWRTDERSFYFATHEVNRTNVAATALPWCEVTERLMQLSQKSKRVIILLDACHSGSAASNEDLVKAILSANAGVMVFASSKGSEVSLENAEWGHGAFTKALLEGLGGKAADDGEKSVTLWDFASYVRRRVKQLTEGAQNPQVPFLQDFDTDAAIVGNP